MTPSELAQRIRNILGNVLLYLRNLVLKTTTLKNWNVVQRQNQQKTLDQYAGQQLVHLEKVMDDQFASSTSRNLKQQLQFLNITKKVTDTIAMTFKNGIQVTAINPDEQEIYDDIVDEVNLDAIMREVDKKVFLTKQVFVKVNYQSDGEEGEMSLDVITPQYCEVTSPDNDPYDFDSIIYPRVVSNPSISNPEGTFAYWDKDTFKLMDQSGNVIENPDNVDNVNPYSPEIPIVLFRESMPSEGQFWAPLGEDLITAQDSLNVKLTMLNQLLKLQSFGIPVLVNPSTNMSGEVTVVIDPTKPIVLNSSKDNPSDFKFVSPDSKIAELQDSIDKDMARIANMYNMNPDDLIASGNRSSADSKNASNASINEVREQRKLVFIPSINELFEAIRVVYNVHNPLTPLSEDGVIIKINDPKKSYGTVDDEIKQNDWDLAHNITTVAQIMVEREDDLTIDEAKENLAQNAIDNGSESDVEDTQEDAQEDMPMSVPDDGIVGENPPAQEDME